MASEVLCTYLHRLTTCSAHYKRAVWLRLPVLFPFSFQHHRRATDSIMASGWEQLMARIAAILNSRSRCPRSTQGSRADTRFSPQNPAINIPSPSPAATKRGREVLHFCHTPLRYPLPPIHRPSCNETRHILPTLPRGQIATHYRSRLRRHCGYLRGFAQHTQENRAPELTFVSPTQLRQLSTPSPSPVATKRGREVLHS